MAGLIESIEGGKFYSAAELAELIGKSNRTLERWRASWHPTYSGSPKCVGPRFVQPYAGAECKYLGVDVQTFLRECRAKNEQMNAPGRPPASGDNGASADRELSANDGR